jgi:hypothetical protein
MIYLATAKQEREVVAIPYCSLLCSSQHGFTMNVRDDDSYEFDEVCANCGVLVPAAHQ